MSKIKLIIAEGYGTERKPYRGHDEVIDLKLAVPDTHDLLGVIRYNFDDDGMGHRVNDNLDPIVGYERINDLVGKLLTLVDSMFHEQEQRKAAKTLFMQAAWDWYGGLTENLKKPWKADRFPKTTAMQEQEGKEVFV